MTSTSVKTHTWTPFRLALAFAAILLLTATRTNAAAQASCEPDPGVVRIDGGAFVMGSNSTYREEAAERDVVVSGFWMDRTEVSVRQFRDFVDATGYVTIAEKPVDASDYPAIDLETNPEIAEMFEPGGAVFSPDGVRKGRAMSWWEYVPGASWRFPEGPDKPASQPGDPVTQVAFEDARAYADWVGGRLPTEAEWEFAALAGKENTAFGRQPPLNANTWQGVFPVANTIDDGFEGVAPVGCFEPNANGLHDMLGNVWEWTADWYAPQQSADKTDPQGISRSQSFDPANPGVPSRVIKGGSFLCADNFCRRYRPAARHPQETGFGTNHIGFRLVYDSNPNPTQKTR